MATADPLLAVDLTDRRGRLVRFGIAATIGVVITALVMLAIESAGVHHNPDPVAQASVGILAIAMFAVTTTVALGLLTKLVRSRAAAASARTGR